MNPPNANAPEPERVNEAIRRGLLEGYWGEGDFTLAAYEAIHTGQFPKPSEATS